MIIQNAKKILEIMDWSPHDFILNFNEKEIKSLSFVHRTFNENDLKFFFKSLKNIYKNYDGLEKVFIPNHDEFFLCHFVPEVGEYEEVHPNFFKC